MLILDYAKQYANRVGASPGYLEQLTVFFRRLPWQIEEVTPGMVDEYLTEALTHLSPQTVANHKRMLTTILDDAVKNGVNTCIHRRFRRVKVPRPIPRAWSRSEIRSLVEESKKERGHFRDLPKSDFLVAWFLAGYCLGLRAGDLHTIRWEQIRGRRLYLIQSKTASPHVAVFTDEALRACKALPRRARVFGDFAAINTIQQWVAKVVKRAGLSGSTKFLRRSCATYSKVQGKSPQHALGHLTEGLAERNYVDRLLYEEEAGINGQPLPEVLDVEDG